MLFVIICLFVFIFGACWGSFLNCLIYRISQGNKLNRGRSFCPKCHRRLGPRDLIPIFSFIFLKRRCRYCHQKISWQYLLVEIAAGLLFVLIFWHLGFGFDLAFGIWALDLIYFWFIVSCLIVIFIYDLRHYIIPDWAIYPAIGAVIIYKLFSALDFGHWDLFRISDLGFRILETLKMPIVAAISAGAFFFLIWLVSRGRWLGFGDVKLAFFMGIFLGFPNILVALFSAFLIGSATGLTLIALKKKKMKSEVPFGPFLVIGTFIGLFWGQNIINWYLNFLL